VVRAEHVRKALSSKMERHNLVETRIREMIEEGTLLVDVAGQRVGQVNGLSVLEIGGYSFGAGGITGDSQRSENPGSSISSANRI